MLAAQVSRKTRLAAADEVIVNDGTLADLAAQVADLDRKYRLLAGKS
jgi:dephospho-CoA kinase